MVQHSKLFFVGALELAAGKDAYQLHRGTIFEWEQL